MSPPSPSIHDERWFALAALAWRAPAPPIGFESVVSEPIVETPIVDTSVIAAFTRNPTLAWTPKGLAVWHGIHLEVVESTIQQLLAAGLVRANGHGSYVLDGGRPVFGQGTRCAGTTR